MTKERVKQAAWIRGLYFDGERRWLNNTVGYGYEIYNGETFEQATTLNEVYELIKYLPKRPKSEW